MFSLSCSCLCVYRKAAPILGAYLVLQGLSGLDMHFVAYNCKQSMCIWRLRLAKALMSLFYLGSSEFCGILLDQYKLDVPSAAQVSGTASQTFPPDPGPFLREGSGDPRATVGPSLASSVAWGAVGGVGWAEGRHTSRSSKHSSTLQQDFILGSSISPLQQNMCLHVGPEQCFPTAVVQWWQLPAASSLPWEVVRQMQDPRCSLECSWYVNWKGLIFQGSESTHVRSRCLGLAWSHSSSTVDLKSSSASLPDAQLPPHSSYQSMGRLSCIR